jgi:hypothetical protein
VDGADFNVAKGATVKLNVSRPDKDKNRFTGSVNADGTVQVPMNAWMLDLAGTLQCDVSIIEGESKLTTMKFSIRVEEEVVCDDSCKGT